MTLAMPDTMWAHKAHALLIPTPLVDLDPAGEAARVSELRVLLAKLDLGIPDWTPEIEALHRRAQQDAQWAHVGDDAVVSRKLHPGLRHPLSGADLPGRSELKPARWSELLDHIRRSLAAPAAAQPIGRYLSLWRDLMRPDAPLGLAHLPGHPIFNDHGLIAHRSAAAALVGARLHGDEAALLHLHVGPVQGFIAAARRTQDLWLGSYIVAYLGMQAVAAIADTLGPDAVLYPDLSTLPLYGAIASFGNRDTDLSGWLRASLPNRFMALVPSLRARELAQAAATRVFKTWSKIAEQVKSTLHDALKSGSLNGIDLTDEKHWKLYSPQIAAHLEIDATIQLWGPRTSYSETFKYAREDLTAQRRLITDLPPEGAPIPKCTQCGEREQIGPDEAFWRAVRQRLDAYFSNKTETAFKRKTAFERETIDLRDGEALCAVCLTKRFANRWYFGCPAPDGSILKLDWEKRDTDRLRLRFPSVATIASAPARSALVCSAADVSTWHDCLKGCHEQLQFTEPGNLLPGLDGPSRTGSMLLDADGTWFFETSYEADTALRDHDLAKSLDELAELKARLHVQLPSARDALKRILRQVAESYGHPAIHITPYYALISLDVDGMGKWLDGTHPESLKRQAFLDTLGDPESTRGITPALHREVSRRQCRLASGPLYDIVEQDNLGRVIYSGGDDLLAFVPLATLWRCLAALHQRFRADDALGAKVTVSAGVAVTHWRAPLSQALHLVRKAEETAKVKRDHLVVSVDKRSGVPLIYSAQWTLTDLVKQAIPRILDPTDDPDREPSSAADAATDNGTRLRLNTLDGLEHELSRLDACPPAAVRARVFAHLTGKRVKELDLKNDPVLANIDTLCECIVGHPAQTRDPGYAKSEGQPALLAFLHLLRFLAREHDPVIAALLPSPRTR